MLRFIHRIIALAGAASLTLTANPAGAATIHVDDDATTGGTGQSWATAFNDLHRALAAARAGDAIWIAEGIYKPSRTGDPSQSFNLAGGMTLYGGFAGNETALEERDPALHPAILNGDQLGNDLSDFRQEGFYDSLGDNSLHVCSAVNLTTAPAVLDGLTIEHGAAIQLPGTAVTQSGGGLYSSGSNIVVRDCIFRVNRTRSGGGGGIYSTGGRVDVEHCQFYDNWHDTGQTTGGGGAIENFGGEINILNCRFERNGCDGPSGKGGAVFGSKSAMTLIGCDFIENTVTSSLKNSPPVGGGLSHMSETLVIDRCRFIGNEAFTGGAMSVESLTTITNCLFLNNRALHGPANPAGQPPYTSAGAIYALPFKGLPVTVIGCTFAANSADYAGAIFVTRNEMRLFNSILWGNTASRDSDTTLTAQLKGLVEIVTKSNCIQGLANMQADADGNFGDDPELMLIDENGPALVPDFDSPCIDAGDNACWRPGIALDLLGQPRFVNTMSAPDTGQGAAPIADLGAVEDQDHNAAAVAWLKSQ